MSVSSFPLVRASDLDYVNAGVEPHSSLLSFFLSFLHFFFFVLSTVPCVGRFLVVCWVSDYSHSCIWDIRISIHLIGGPCVLDLIELTSQHLYLQPFLNGNIPQIPLLAIPTLRAQYRYSLLDGISTPVYLHHYKHTCIHTIYYYILLHTAYYILLHTLNYYYYFYYYFASPQPGRSPACSEILAIHASSSLPVQRDAS